MPANTSSSDRLSISREFYKRTYLDIERRWIKLGADGRLNYQIRNLIPLMAGPLWVLDCGERPFSMRRPSYTLEDGRVQDFGLLYYRPTRQPTKTIWVNSRSIDLTNDYHREVTFGTSYVFAYEAANHFGLECGLLPKLSQEFRQRLNEFCEARADGLVKGKSVILSTQHTAIARAIQGNISSLDDVDYGSIHWSFFHTNTPFPLALAFSVNYESEEIAYASVVCSVGMSKLSFLANLRLVRPLTVKDKLLIATIEKGLNRAERRRV